MAKVAPLRSRTMTLDQLQRRTLKVLNEVKKHLRRQPWKSGVSDEQFIYDPIETLMIDIRQDREVLKMHRRK